MKKQPPNRLPLLAIIGRPNVGKSTLFNRLVGERKALVDDMPGVTRDRNYGQMDWVGQVWNLVDTGGFEPETDDDVLRAMREQTALAIAEADGIIFLLDGQDGLTPADREVANILRRQGKPVFHAVNKIDGPKHDLKLAEFYALGVDRVFGVSASHGYGVDDLLDAIKEVLPGLPAKELEADEPGLPRVTVIGRPNVGKSTLINALLGRARLLVHDQPGTTRDAVDSEVVIAGKKYIFVDTAGLRRKKKIDTRVERFSVMRTIQSIERCHLAVVMMDATAGIADQDAKIAGLAHERGRAVILCFNKWDLVADKEARRAELTREIEARLPHVNYAPVLTISALDGTRVAKLGELLEQVMAEYNRRVGTGELNRKLEQWVAAHHPPARGKYPVKFLYATEVGVRPPTFVFFVNRSQPIPVAYERYLVNQLRESFGFTGSPLRVLFRARKSQYK